MLLVLCFAQKGMRFRNAQAAKAKLDTQNNECDFRLAGPGCCFGNSITDTLSLCVAAETCVAEQGVPKGQRHPQHHPYQALTTISSSPLAQWTDHFCGVGRRRHNCRNRPPLGECQAPEGVPSPSL